MNIDLTSLLTSKDNLINIDMPLEIEEEKLKNTNIRHIKNTSFVGNISKNDEMYTLSGSIQGTMVLSDDMTLEDVDYDFDIKIDEKFMEFSDDLENNLKIINNSLDIFPFLWQNILLEVPSKVRKTGQNPKLSGDNWKVITEDELETINKSLSSLKELFNQRKE
ncbi:MAG: YceD family protein [Bacilli bacterium]